MTFLLWFIPSLALLGAGFVFGLLTASEMGPSYKWRWKHQCHHGEPEAEDARPE